MSSQGAGTRTQSQVVYAAGLVQGIVLVTFPAASTIFTSAGSYGLSSSQYGAMFLPQAITAVGSSLLQGNLVVAVALGVLSLAVAHGRPSPRSVHPRPQPLGKPRSAPELVKEA